MTTSTLTPKKFRWAAMLAGVLCLASSAAFAGYTDRDIHDSGDATYKHPNQKSFTGPFDYAPSTTPAAPEKQRERGKCNEFTFDATKSHDIDRDKLTVNWDFGDGTSSDQPVVTKAFEKAGAYDVKLTVKDSSGQICDTGVATVRVDANYPPLANAGEDRTACLGDTVNFDATGSEVHGTPAYRWDFGDGQVGEGARVSHQYEKAGNYRARLFIDDGKGTECSTGADSVNVSIGERADVALTGAEAICLGQTARLSAKGSGGLSNYRWDFGDGHTWEGGSSASHQYEKPGSYTVRVSADNGRGSDCSAAADSTTVVVHGQPVASAGENLVCCVGQETAFDASNSTSPAGGKLSYLWNFGDGTTAEGERVSHTYKEGGNYRVVLTVQDDSGSACSSSSDSFVAVVNAQPEAVIQVR